VVISTADWPEGADAQARDGILVRTCEMRLGENPKLAGIKHLCRLEQVLAQLELEGTGADEGMLLNTSGYIVGGISCNVFAVFGLRVVTPRLTRSGVRGVMRRAVVAAANAVGIAVSEIDLDPARLAEADELFVTNALTGIRPVRELDGRPYSLGPVTRSLQAAVGVWT
jgi:4-amino-4-deoxychorismate lyase